ncbi:alkylphosphonate utilization protein [Olivibacter ginsenosidimutans]|uniref:Alkylphosphonate utilization protein n=1 Tax=Olivibacter ginsenosidimutans TaxID=1176537 RepID=A0ABP9C5N9_9SPHI
MNDKLAARSGGKCELSGDNGELVVYSVGPENYGAKEINIAKKLADQLSGVEPFAADDWRFLPEAMWSEVPAVQVLSWRLLNHLKNESWAADALDIIYLDDERLAWAKAAPLELGTNETLEQHKDANGNILQHGDSVVLTKTLDVKGSSISAKLGTVVRNIRLVEGNPEQIEGRVEGQLIVILTKYLRKQ